MCALCASTFSKTSASQLLMTSKTVQTVIGGASVLAESQRMDCCTRCIFFPSPILPWCICRETKHPAQPGLINPHNRSFVQITVVFSHSDARPRNNPGNTRRTCQRLHRDLAMGVAGDCARSGTTLCAAVLTGRRLTVANVGDSGCLRISRVVDEICRLGDPTATGSGVVESEASAGGRRRRETGEVETEHRGSDRRVVVERLSRDHKPECSDELKRIQAAGGVVFPLQSAAVRGGRGVSGVPTAVQGGRQEGAETVRDFGAEVSRVWRPGGSGPGLAMSRSLGDKVIH